MRREGFDVIKRENCVKYIVRGRKRVRLLIKRVRSFERGGCDEGKE